MGTFASRVDIAYALSVITKQDRTDLNIIRRIRNTFAHAVKNIASLTIFQEKRSKPYLLFLEYSKVTIPEKYDINKVIYIVSCHRLSKLFDLRREDNLKDQEPISSAFRTSL